MTIDQLIAELQRLKEEGVSGSLEIYFIDIETDQMFNIADKVEVYLSKISGNPKLIELRGNICN